MRIFVTGGNGQLAKSSATLYQDDEMYLATKDKLDITNKRQTINAIIQFKPDIVFHFASLTKGDECAKNPELARKINVTGTKNVIEACLRTNAQLLFVSTNEVFDGKKNKPYTERDKPNPKTVVGKTKHLAEKLIREKIKKHFIVRTSWLYSDWSNNFIHVVFKIARNRNAITLVQDEISSPTYSFDLMVAIKQLIKTKKYGLYHIANNGAVSRLDFAKRAFEMHGLSQVKITPVNLDQYSRLSKPPLFSALSSNKIDKLGIIMPDWEDALQRYLREGTFD